jgi:predicted small lipoprotein YifL
MPTGALPRNCRKTNNKVRSNLTDRWLAASLAVALLAIAGCGLKGDLYLPEEPTPEDSAQQGSTAEDLTPADGELAGDDTEQQRPGVE